jgi:hypothetical protein
MKKTIRVKKVTTYQKISVSAFKQVPKIYVVRPKVARNCIRIEGLKGIVGLDGDDFVKELLTVVQYYKLYILK